MSYSMYKVQSIRDYDAVYTCIVRILRNICFIIFLLFLICFPHLFLWVDLRAISVLRFISNQLVSQLFQRHKFPVYYKLSHWHCAKILHNMNKLFLNDCIIYQFKNHMGYCYHSLHAQCFNQDPSIIAFVNSIC